MAKSSSAVSSAKARRVKKQLKLIVDRHRAMAFNEGIRMAADEHPGGYAFPRWFLAAWEKSIP